MLCSFPTIELAYEAVRYGNERDLPVILDVRDLWPDIFIQGLPRSLRWLSSALLFPYLLLTRAAFARASSIPAVSKVYLEWGVRQARRDVGEHDRVFPLGYRLQPNEPTLGESRSEFRRRFRIPDEAILCLFAGTMGRTYDLGPMLEAAARLNREGNDRFRFVICGDGEGRAEWELMGGRNRLVKFTGWLKQVDIHSALVASDIGIAAYAHGAPQGIPYKVIEYLAAGLPALASLEGETEALLTQYGCGLKYNSLELVSFYNALMELSSDQVRRQMSHNGSALFSSQFSAEAVYRDFSDYLERIAVSSVSQ